MRQSVLRTRHDTPVDSGAGGTASTAYLRILAWAAEWRGLSPTKILREATIDPAALERREARVPMASALRVWDQIVGQLRDPSVGLCLVQTLSFGSSDLLDYLLRASANAGEALQQLVRYAPLMNDVDRVSMQVSGNEARVRFRTARDLPYTCELIAGIFARRSRELFGPSWALRSVSFSHPAQGPRPVYDRAFEAPVLFEMPFNEIVFDRQLLDLPMSGADRRLQGILAAQADELLASVVTPPAPETFTQLVRQALADGLEDGDTTLVRLADRLQLSTRTIQRKLREAGLSHRGLVRDLRLDLASRSLAGQQATQRQIARALGYSGAGSFHRAFKRWSGMTPGAVRARRNEHGGGSETEG
jgi:AraC-like DNA-binding protein